MEPFAGSACLFFAIRPRHSILGDLNIELIHMYQTVRKNPEVVYGIMSSWDSGKTEYLRIRGLNPDSLAPYERAARFIYLNRFCFNGLYRTNKSGGFNVPYGGRKTGALPNIHLLRFCASALRKSRLMAADFRKTLSNVQRGDFVYLDPPYSVENRRVFKEYGAHSFGTEDLKDLGAQLCIIDQRRAHFVASYADCAEARRVFENWTTYRCQTRRNVAGFHKARRKQYELVATNLPR